MSAPKKNPFTTEQYFEQCRLLGMSAERELQHLAKIAAMRRELTEIHAALNDPRVDLIITAAQAIRELKGLNHENQNKRDGSPCP